MVQLTTSAAGTKTPQKKQRNCAPIATYTQSMQPEVHPARRFIQPSKSENAKSEDFSNSLRQIGDICATAGQSFSRSLGAFANLFTHGSKEISSECTERENTIAPVPLPGPRDAVPNLPRDSFQSYGESTLRQPPAKTGSPKSWEDGQKDLDKLRKQLYEKRERETQKIAARSVLKETAMLQKQMQSRNVRDALERRKLEASARTKETIQQDQHREGRTMQVKLGQWKGTKTFHKASQRAIEGL